VGIGGVGGLGREITQALYAHINNKKKIKWGKIKYGHEKNKSKERRKLTPSICVVIVFIHYFTNNHSLLR
jgi:hypothetical protein